MSEESTQTQAPPPIQPPPPSASLPLPNPGDRARTWNMLCHLSALLGFVGVPLGNVLGPLMVWQIKKNEFSSVDIHGKAALNFQLTVLIALLAGSIITVIGFFFCIGFLFIPVLILIGLCGLVFPIIAGVKANNGEEYKYPYCINFLK